MALLPNAGEQAFSKEVAGKTLLWLGACESKQFSYCRRPYCLFTGKLLKALEGSPRTPIRDIFASVAAQVVEASKALPQRAQNPQSEGATDQPLLMGATPAPPAAPTPTPAAASTAILDSLRLTPGVIPTASNPFRITAKLDRSVYVTNELSVLTVQSSEDAFVRVFVISADASLTQVFPNRWQTDNRLRKGATVRIPAEGETRWRLRITEPFGTGIVMVQARRELFSDLAKGVEYTGTFLDLGHESPAQTRARGMKAEENVSAPPTQGASDPAPTPCGRAETMVSNQVVQRR